MKHILTFVLVFFYFCGYSQVVVKGKIHNYDGKSIIYYNPTIEGIHTPYWFEIIPSPGGKFKIQYKNEGYGTLDMSFAHLSYRFFHDENSEIYVEIDQSNINIPKNCPTGDVVTYDSIRQVATQEISGDYEEVNQFYNKVLRTSFVTTRSVGGNYYAYMIAKAENPEQVMTILDSLTQIELNQINALHTKVDTENPDAKPIDQEVKQFLENEVRAFYGSIFLSGMFLKRKEQVTRLIKDPDAPLTIYNKEWEALTETFFEEMANHIVPAANSFDFNEFVQNTVYAKDSYKNYDFKDPGKSNDEYIVETLLQPDSALLDSLFFLDDQSALAYKLDMLKVYLYNQNFYSPVLLGTLNELKAQHPESAHFEHFEPQIEKLKAYLQASTQDYDKGKIIETNYATFNDLLESLKGENLLIDIWATWCGPCIDEFKYKSVLQPFIREGKLALLYISIDKQRWENKWRENIKYNQLEGYHVLADDVLIRDMWKELAGMTGAIPRYALVDKKGEIFINEAARPSESEALIKQINELISTSNSTKTEDKENQ